MAFNKAISRNRIVLAFAYYALIVISILLFSAFAKWIIISSGIDYDFENLLELKPGSYASLTGIVGLLLIQFYGTYLLSIKVKSLDLNYWVRFSCLLSAILLSIPIYYLIDLQIGYFPYYLSVTSFLFLADLFIDKRETSIIWIIFWMITLCSLAAILLFNFYLKYDLNHRIDFAKSLIEEKDTTNVNQLQQLSQSLDDGSTLAIFDSIPNPLKIHKVEYNQILEIPLSQYTNLDQRTKPILNAYDRFGNAMVFDQYTSMAYYNDFIKNSIALDTNIFFDPVSNIYLLTKLKAAKSHPGSPFHIFLEFLPADQFNEPEKLLTNTYKKISEAPDYGVYINGILKKSNTYAFKNENQRARSLQKGEYYNYNEGNIANLVYKVDDHTSIHLQSKYARLIKPISLFSFLFILMGVLLSLIALANTRWNFLPDEILLKLSNISSLRRRIQLSIVILSIFSFVAIGIVTIFYFRYLSNEYDAELIEEKNVAITADISARMQNADKAKNALRILESNIHAISETHQVDIHLFDQEGRLINSSASKLFELGFSQVTLNKALINLLRSTNNVYQEEDLIELGDLKYRNIFIPVIYSSQSSSQNENLAYLQLLHTSQIKTQNNVTDFVGTLLNVYVFLFLFAGAIALAVANSITRPITVLGNQIKNFKLGRKNKQLEWDTEDELGQLISNYNEMANQLDESAMMIAKTEREGAWREMAKQVAHEIKNPLTPMKLSIQYMQRAIRKSEDPEKLVNNVSNTIIEQIDNLSQIASEFSNFGTMPQGSNEKIILNEIVETIHDLFRKRDDMDIYMTEPLDEIYVFADRNHLIRVLNNILKNAIQAIPTDRRGRIDLKLYKKSGIAVVEIKDNGIGIPDHMKDKVFTPNFTTKSSGTGLGLAIAANMMESFNGHIRFSTVLDRGTTFYIEIPLMHVKDNFDNVERISLELG
ncbi:sensor histidine kinase [Portibacter marinus]|uniref:sensor histidine kinase n=1 Tax=Portibacter marinus TaxID=2898660 RepID=UPI001F192FF5|nr:ATP-binding protein [Portibacter marinus]